MIFCLLSLTMRISCSIIDVLRNIKRKRDISHGYLPFGTGSIRRNGVVFLSGSQPIRSGNESVPIKRIAEIPAAKEV